MEIKQIGKIPTDEELIKITTNTKCMPFRLCYEKGGGNVWHKLREEENYSNNDIGNRELTTLKRSLPKIKKFIKNEPINILHIGPGDGIEIPELFSELKPKDNALYAGIDISRTMLYNTKRIHQEQLLKTKTYWYQTDIETRKNLTLISKDAKNQGVKKNLVCLLGQGVISSNEKSWQCINDCLSVEDLFYLTIEGDCPEQRDKICHSYDLPFVRDLISIGLEKVGYKTNKGNFKTEFNSKKSRIEVYFTSEKNEKILSLTSYKPTEKGLIERLERQNFNILYIKFYKDLHTFAVLCKKGRKNV